MVGVRFLKLLLLGLLVTTAVIAEEGSAGDVATEDCATPGECANPEAAAAVGESVEVTADEGKEEEAPAVVEDPEPETEEASKEEDPSCPSRPHIVRCAGEYLDTDKNNKLERSELEAAMSKLPWYARGILRIIGSVDKIMKKCDYDGDGAISIDVDMEKTKETCLATCFKRRSFKSAFFPDCEA
mmetsp:Transcript_29795/g.43941  ORF Transcript_29795/g.43941 Transcript_29795/m.43941 type:complete len:185 (-) Transcript_29795:160-714(-)|eukprot:CAMPEP_0194035974 /NCGR_PEP_ID=MMETSP0009_2-20130614/8384_1 /TAXON_ID=210454 /ORGANISM="Grammatophora oceanica, Strain CCMP 410" /LENGTH=184 /DNA_ID=CAMNT_0038677553 /DNA_START=96 /DNA_END=650 /DNA_ORIENTATION=-